MTKTATMRLIEQVERLNMTGVIGDSMVAHLHELAAMARLEQARVSSAMIAIRDNDPAEPIADNGATVLDAVRADAADIFGVSAYHVRAAARSPDEWRALHLQNWGKGLGADD